MVIDPQSQATCQPTAEAVGSRGSKEIQKPRQERHIWQNCVAPDGASARDMPDAYSHGFRRGLIWFALKGFCKVAGCFKAEGETADRNAPTNLAE